MGRPAKTQKSVPLNVSLDADVAAKMKSALFSELEQKIPHGAQSALINAVLRRHFRSAHAKEVYHQTQAAAERPEVKQKVAADLEAFLSSESPQA